MDALAVLKGELEEKSAHDVAFHVTDISPLQPLNVLLPMDFTAFGMDNEVNPAS